MGSKRKQGRSRPFHRRAFAYLICMSSAGLTYRKSETYYRCPVSEQEPEKYKNWAALRLLFVVSGLNFLQLNCTGMGYLWCEGTNKVSQDCALFAGLTWMFGTGLMHVIPKSGKCDTTIEGMHLVPAGELYPVLGELPSEEEEPAVKFK